MAVYEELVEVVVGDYYLLFTVHCYIQSLLHILVGKAVFEFTLHGINLNGVCPGFPLLHQYLESSSIQQAQNLFGSLMTGLWAACCF